MGCFVCLSTCHRGPRGNPGANWCWGQARRAPTVGEAADLLWNHRDERATGRTHYTRLVKGVLSGSAPQLWRHWETPGKAPSRGVRVQGRRGQGKEGERDIRGATPGSSSSRGAKP